MLPLPLANILHHKLRSALAMLGVAIAVCMLVTLSGLSRGSLEEIADRWQAVDADMIVYPATWGENITTVSGGGMGDADISRILALTAAEKALDDLQKSDALAPARKARDLAQKAYDDALAAKAAAHPRAAEPLKKIAQAEGTTPAALARRAVKEWIGRAGK